MATQPRHTRFYGRYGNPTLERCERTIAALEGTESALLVASGMAAMATSVLALCRAGDHVVGQERHYMGTTELLTEVLPSFGVRTTIVDQTDLDAWRAALADGAAVAITETPVNPTLAITDLAGVAELAHAAGAITICDNTFASPVNQTPAAHGIDLVVHSGTKYLGGHSDLLAGAVAGSAALLERIWRRSIILGATLGPFDAWLLLRGIRTLPLRVRQVNESGLVVARFLAAHPAVARVHYPGLEAHPQHGLAARQMRGFGGTLSFELAGGYTAARSALSRLQVISEAVSLGGVESLAMHPASVWTGTVGAERAAEAAIDAGLVRLSLGIEGADDLVADLAQALA